MAASFWDFVDGGDWPGCHVAHGKAPWILGIEVPGLRGTEGYLMEFIGMIWNGMEWYGMM